MVLYEAHSTEIYIINVDVIYIVCTMLDATR